MPPNKKKSQRNANGKRNAISQGLLVRTVDTVPVPKPICADVIRNMKVRFQTSTAQTLNSIFWSSLVQLFWRCATTTTGNASFKCFRIRKVEVFCPATPDAAPDTVSLQYGSGVEGILNLSQVTDSTSSNRGAYVCIKFSKATVAGQYHDAEYAWSDLVAFRVSAPANAILDLHFEAILQSQGLAVVCSGGTPGTEYVNYLDNTTSAGTAGTQYWAPVAITSFSLKLAY